MPTPELSAIIESKVLDQTEDALRELCTAARNVGLSKLQVALMLQKVAEELAPSIIVSPSSSVQ